MGLLIWFLSTRKGLNIDIEQYEGPREPLTSLVAELSAALKGFNPHLQLSFDLAIFPSGQAEHYDHAALSQHLDFIFPMAYDEPWGSKVAAANSPLAALRRGVAEYVGLGVPASKLVVGLPWYGWDWPCTTNATDAPCDVVPPCGRPWFGWATQVGYSNIQAKLKASSATLRTDNVSITRYFDYTVATGDAIGRHQLWFDDPVTLAQKYRVRQLPESSRISSALHSISLASCRLIGTCSATSTLPATTCALFSVCGRCVVFCECGSDC